MCHADKTYPVDFVLGRKIPKTEKNIEEVSYPKKENEHFVPTIPN